MTFEEWADRTFGGTFKEEETLTYFRMNAAWEVATHVQRDMARDECERLRERILDGIDECPGLTIAQDKWLSDMVRSN